MLTVTITPTRASPRQEHKIAQLETENLTRRDLVNCILQVRKILGETPFKYSYDEGTWDGSDCPWRAWEKQGKYGFSDRHQEPSATRRTRKNGRVVRTRRSY